MGSCSECFEAEVHFYVEICSKCDVDENVSMLLEGVVFWIVVWVSLIFR